MINNNRRPERIRKFGEVFTPSETVQAMLDMDRDEFIRFDSRVLEPACGDGNFLAPILEERIKRITQLFKNNQIELEKALFKSVSSLYGVDILNDNIDKCILRLYTICDSYYSNKFKEKSEKEFLNIIKLVLKLNVIQGDALKFTAQNGKPLYFYEWVMLNRGNIKIKKYEYHEIADFDESRPTLFSKREVNDLGEGVFSPYPVQEFDLVYFKKITEEIFK